MFDAFQNQFDESSSIENQMLELKGIPFKYSELLLACGGKTYDKGLYTVHTFENSVKWTKLLKSYFPTLQFDFISFSQDWLGRQFCVPIGIGEYILVLDPADQTDGHIDTNLINFHDDLLVKNKEEFFSSEYFLQILEHLGVEEITYKKCVGLKTSLFLGGEEEMSNYCLWDIEMYWDFENQIYKQISLLPPETKVENVFINPFTGGNK